MNTEVKDGEYAMAVEFCNIVVNWYSANADTLTLGEFGEVSVDREWPLLRKMTAAIVGHPTLVTIYLSLIRGDSNYLEMKHKHLEEMFKDLGFSESQIEQYIDLSISMDRFLFGKTEGKKPSIEEVKLRLIYLKGWEEKHLM